MFQVFITDSKAPINDNAERIKYSNNDKMISSSGTTPQPTTIAPSFMKKKYGGKLGLA